MLPLLLLIIMITQHIPLVSELSSQWLGFLETIVLRINFYHSGAYAFILHTARICRKELYAGEQGELGIRCLIPQFPYNKYSLQRLIRKDSKYEQLPSSAGVK